MSDNIFLNLPYATWISEIKWRFCTHTETAKTPIFPLKGESNKIEEKKMKPKIILEYRKVLVHTDFR